MDEDADGTRTAQGGYLDSGKCSAYRGLWGRRGRHVRRRLGGYRDGEQRVLRAPASGPHVAKPNRHQGHGYAEAQPDRQHVHLGGTDHTATDHTTADHTATHYTATHYTATDHPATHADAH